MKLPQSFKDEQNWTLVGPMGPDVPDIHLKRKLMAVDGGANHLPKAHIWIGDHDSCTNAFQAEYTFKHPTQKSVSDFALALKLFNQDHPYSIHAWGFLGGRKDHELFNIGEALGFLKNHPESELYFYNDKGETSFYLISAGEWSLEHHGAFSIGTTYTLSLTLTGKCEYKLTQGSQIDGLNSLGLSNSATGVFNIETDGPLFIYFPEGKL